MPTSPISVKLFTITDVLVWGGLDLLVTGLAVGAALTKQDLPVAFAGWAILWAVVACFWGISFLFFHRRWVFIKHLHFVLDPPGLTVGWDVDSHCVSIEAVQAEYNDLLAKMSGEFPRAGDALRGCLIWFREQTWVQDDPASFIHRKIAGETKDGQLIVVGWRVDLTKSALKHEMAHRVLQAFGGNPSEATAHETMARLGVN